MSGLAKICRAYGSIMVNGQKHVWDYAQEKPVLESEMPHGSERHKASEQAKWAGVESTIKRQRREGESV